MFAALVVCRWAHYAAALMVFGTSVFVAALAPPRLAERLATAWRFWARAGALIVGVTTLAWLSLEAGAMGEGWADALRPDTIGAVLFDTAFGRAWQVHGILAAGLLAAVAWGRPVWVCLAAGLVLASLASIGHAAMLGALPGWLQRGVLALHLLAAGFWIGGLWPLLATLREAAEPDLRTEAIRALRRYSTIGHVAVATVVLTGVANAVATTGGAVLGSASAYSLLLALKVATVLVMIALALANRYWLVPRLRLRPDNARSIIRNTQAEIGLGAVTVGLVSVFGLLDPHG